MLSKDIDWWWTTKYSNWHPVIPQHKTVRSVTITSWRKRQSLWIILFSFWIFFWTNSNATADRPIYSSRNRITSSQLILLITTNGTGWLLCLPDENTNSSGRRAGDGFENGETVGFVAPSLCRQHTITREWSRTQQLFSIAAVYWFVVLLGHKLSPHFVPYVYLLLSSPSIWPHMLSSSVYICTIDRTHNIFN